MQSSAKMILTSITTLLACTNCLANNFFVWPQHSVLSIGAGPALSSDAGTSKTFPIVNPDTDEFFIYQANQPNQTVGAFDAFIGGEWILRSNWALQLGLGYHQVWNFRANGTLVQGADVASQDTYTYHYDILVRQVLAEAKLLYQYKKYYHPYLLLGLGSAFNSATDYGTSVPPFLTFTRQYANHTESSFTYLAGFGVDVDVMEHLRLGVGYRFADFGNIALGNATIDTTSVSGTLTQNHLYVSEILGQITIVV